MNRQKVIERVCKALKLSPDDPAVLAFVNNVKAETILAATLAEIRAVASCF